VLVVSALPVAVKASALPEQYKPCLVQVCVECPSACCTLKTKAIACTVILQCVVQCVTHCMALCPYSCHTTMLVCLAVAVPYNPHVVSWFQLHSTLSTPIFSFSCCACCLCLHAALVISSGCWLVHCMPPPWGGGGHPCSLTLPCMISAMPANCARQLSCRTHVTCRNGSTCASPCVLAVLV
jgi:hypothetical protein